MVEIVKTRELKNIVSCNKCNSIISFDYEDIFIERVQTILKDGKTRNYIFCPYCMNKISIDPENLNKMTIQDIERLKKN